MSLLLILNVFFLSTIFQAAEYFVCMICMHLHIWEVDHDAVILQGTFKLIRFALEAIEEPSPIRPYDWIRLNKWYFCKYL